MHESSLARSLVHTINTIAIEQGALGVVAAKVRLGDFSAMSEESLREHFARAARGTRVEGALLKVHSPNSDTYGGDGDNGDSGDSGDSDADDNAAGPGVVLESVELLLELSASL